MPRTSPIRYVSSLMRFGLIANLKRPGAHNAIAAMQSWVSQHNHQIIGCAELRSTLPLHIPCLPRSDVASQVDVLVSMGGDGTLLAAARTVGEKGVPILGINLGSLGFLTQQTPQQLPKALEAVAAGQYVLDERMVLRAELRGTSTLAEPFALNDIVLDNKPSGRTIEITLRVNGEDVVTYRADGLIIATPTGSTAYNLAVGGPILHPKMEAMIAAPIAAFSLNVRPMLFSPEDRLELLLSSEGRQAQLTIDGQVGSPLNDAERVLVTRAPHRLKLISFPGTSFYQFLTKKLHWGIAPRNEG